MLSFAKIHCILDLTKQSQINLYLLKFILTTIETIETISFALPIYIIVEKKCLYCLYCRLFIRISRFQKRTSSCCCRLRARPAVSSR